MPRLFPIPQPKAPIQGPTIQTVDWFHGPNQPELAYYSRGIVMQGVNSQWNEGPREQFTGPKNQPTFPVPPVSQPEQIQWAAPQRNRYLVDEPRRFDGATVQPSYVFFPSQPEVSSWLRRDMNRYVVDTRKFVDAVVTTLPQTFPVPPVSLPQFAYYRPDINWTLTGPARQFEGASLLQTFPLPPLSQPETNRFQQWQNAQRNQPEAVKRYEGATVQQTYVFFPNQPEPTRFLALQTNRYLVDAFKRFDGATVQATFPVPLVSQPEQSQYTVLQGSRFRVLTVLPIDGVFIPPISTGRYLLLLGVGQ